MEAQQYPSPMCQCVCMWDLDFVILNNITCSWPGGLAITASLLPVPTITGVVGNLMAPLIGAACGITGEIGELREVEVIVVDAWLWEVMVVEWTEVNEETATDVVTLLANKLLMSEEFSHLGANCCSWLGPWGNGCVGVEVVCRIPPVGATACPTAPFI